MTRQNVSDRCRRISAGYNENGVCCFADNGGLLGFIDTSQGQNGTRGIAFSDDRVLMNFDGEPLGIFYDKIKGVQIISSFEDFFADELLVVYSDGSSDKEIRISDFSLDKSELKRLLDGLCGKDSSEKGTVVSPKSTSSESVSISAQKTEDHAQNAGDLPQSAPISSQNEKKADVRSVSSVSDKHDRTITDVLFTADVIRADKPTAPRPADTSAHTASAEPRSRVREDPPGESPVNGGRTGLGGVRGNADTKSVSDNKSEAIPPVFQRRDDFVDIVFENRAPVITETVLPQAPIRTSVIGDLQSAQTMEQPYGNNGHRTEQTARNTPVQTEYPRVEAEDETAERMRIQNMSPEETLSYLAQSLNEINAPLPEPEPVQFIRQPEPEPNIRQPEMIVRNSAPPVEKRSAETVSVSRGGTADNSARPVHVEEPRPEPLTEEPIWGDIYIKASRNLRELCESGRLSMKQIETELNDKLLDSARAFAEITADESKVPKVLIPKITELKAAAKNFDTYFQSGEDIAVRAMFFMMYQMLSYADRIVETPETKERLNDFFRRFGPAGITLSMLDMRV